MIDFRNYRSLEEALALTMRDKTGLETLASLTNTAIDEISETAVQEDWYGDMHLIKTAVQEIWKTPTANSFIVHSIWCSHREARWLHGKTKNIELINNFYQPEHFIETQNKPTIIIAPMTLGTYDALQITLNAIDRFQPERPIIFYGENMESYLALHPEHKKLFAPNSLQGIKQILETLASGGLFLTYPDFVYQGHAAIQGELFGMPRSFSSSFLKILLKSEAEILPVTIVKSENELQMRFFRSISTKKPSEYKLLPTAVQVELNCLLVSKILEGLILQIPNQWRLLSTLTHESEGMA